MPDPLPHLTKDQQSSKTLARREYLGVGPVGEEAGARHVGGHCSRNILIHSMDKPQLEA
jgi:hypothetical protein